MAIAVRFGLRVGDLNKHAVGIVLIFCPGLGLTNEYSALGTNILLGNVKWKSSNRVLACLYMYALL